MRNRFEEHENNTDAILEWGIKGIAGLFFLGIALWGLWHISHTIFSLVWNSLPWIFGGAIFCGGWQWMKQKVLR